MAKYILGIDAGTSVTKACILNLQGEELATAQRQIPISSPQPGWAEQDMWDIWKAVTEVIPEVMEKASVTASEIIGVGVTGQGDGIWYVDRNGEPLGPAVLWTDNRSSEIVQRWIKDGSIDRAFQITGMCPYTGSANAIMRWDIENRPEYLAKAYKNLWCKDWIQLNLTGTFTTDPSEASPFGLDVRNRRYSDEVLDIYDLHEGKHVLADMVESMEIVGNVTAKAASQTGLLEGTPVVKGMFDLPATATGVGCVIEGRGTTVLGTTCANQAATASPPFEPANTGFILAHGIPGLWIRAMAVNYGTPNIDWFVKMFGAAYKAEAEQRGVSLYEVLDEALTRTPAGSRGIVYSPYLGPGGERAPFLNPNARAQFFGLTEGHTLDDMLRSVYEGVGLAIMDAYDNIPVEISQIALSGGGAKSATWCQMISNVLGKELFVPSGTEFGARGVAMFAGVAVGAFDNIEQAAEICVKAERTYKPDMSEHAKYAELFKVYRRLRDDVTPAWDELANARAIL